MKRKFLENIRDWDQRGVLSVVGPTGCGKTSTVLNYLRSLPSGTSDRFLLVSVDSVAFYQGLDIGSAKVIGEDRYDFCWIGMDFLDLDAVATSKRFLKEVQEPIVAHLAVGNPVILVGGSGFYERALVEGVAPGEKSDETYQRTLDNQSNEELHAKLLSFDRRWGEKIYPNDRYRVTRYLDLVDRQGFSWDELRNVKLRHPELEKIWNETSMLVLGAQGSRSIFREPLKARIEEMFARGWLEETKALLSKWGPSVPGIQSMGYREILPYFDGAYDLARCKELILSAHMAYVKRQRTWFKAL